MSLLIRSSALAHYAAVAQRAGIDPHEMLALVGLNPSCLDHSDLRIPSESFHQLLELSAADSGVETFGLQMAEFSRLSNLGMVGRMARDQPSQRLAIEVLIKYAAIINESLLITLEEAEGTALLMVELVYSRTKTVHQSLDLSLGMLFRAVQGLIGPDWMPRRVCFEHPAPADLRIHRRMFGQHLAFDREFTGLVFSSDELDRPRPSADPTMAYYAKRYLEAAYPEVSQSGAHKIRQLALGLLPNGRCNLDQVAQHLGVDRRTVHRRLRQEGESFSGMVNNLRRGLVARHLANPQRDLSAIAELVGFASLSAFSRWYRQQYGVSVTQQRQQAIAPGRRAGQSDG